ncbi:MAG: hypothetical protein A2992_07290 [Elusimicrobia bacterium RIFCSPLOWO2_01_FULL_59_12]|nr:MAG: hypothetical protein A2992_07290 [Elusimicrobia bacterium RIFCSPLOWO2_01_FULL_59_12]
MNHLNVSILAAVSLMLGACSKAPEPAAKASEPDNAVTRYAENLAAAPAKAQASVDKANAAIAQQQDIMNQATDQP